MKLYEISLVLDLELLNLPINVLLEFGRRLYLIANGIKLNRSVKVNPFDAHQVKVAHGSDESAALHGFVFDGYAAVELTD